MNFTANSKTTLRKNSASLNTKSAAFLHPQLPKLKSCVRLGEKRSEIKRVLPAAIGSNNYYYPYYYVYIKSTRSGLHTEIACLYVPKKNPELITIVVTI